MLAGVGAWALARVLNRRRVQAEMAGNAARSWGGRDHERMRHKYFEKERRARAQRARSQHARATHGAADRGPSASAEPNVPGPVNLERLHGETLGLKGRVTPDAVRKAYKARVREYHPDQVARLGIKLRLLAEEETKRINEAYAFFRKRYGF
jgi:DnaJ-domain-containing protein 1